MDYWKRVSDRIDSAYTLIVKLGRDHGKTWLSIAKFVRFIVEQAPLRCITVATQAKYREIYEFVNSALELDSIRKAYGDLKASSSIANGIWFVESHRPKVGPNFVVKSSEAFITGLHFEGANTYFYDPEDIQEDLIGWLHLEDIVQEMKVDSAAERRLRRWVKRTTMLIRNHNVRLTVNATSKDKDDLYSMMENELHFPVYIEKAFEVVSGRLPTRDEVVPDHDRQLLLSWENVGTYRDLQCPNWPMPRLLYWFVYLNTTAEAELNNNTIPNEGSYFKWEDFVQVDPYPDEFEKYIVVDPAFGESGSKTAILVLMLRYGKMVIVDAFVGHATADQKIKHILDFNRKHDPDKIYIEDNFNQESRSFHRANPLSTLQSLIPFNSTGNKRRRIAHLEAPILRHEIEVYKTIPFLPDLKVEVVTFDPENLSDKEIREKFNMIDTLAMGYKKLKNLMDRTENRKQEPEHSLYEVW